MSYIPFTWKDSKSGGTPITAARLNAIETGLDATADVADAAAIAAAAANSLADSARGTAISANLTAVAASTAANAPNGTINVKVFGAKGDGNTDDTAALQAAFTASAYGHIVIPPGTYIISGGLTVPQGVRLFGHRATIVANFSTNYKILTLGNDTRVYGLGFTSNWGSVSSTAIYASGVDSIHVRDCVIDQIAGKGIWLANCTNYLIHANRITNTLEQGINLDRTSYGRITNNRCESNQHGIQYWGGDSGNATDYAAGPGTHHLTISNNICRNGSAAVSAGIWGSLGRYITIANNVVENYNDIGIDLEGTFDSTVTGNTVNDGGGHCFAVVNGSSRCVFANNSGYSNTGGSAFRFDTGVTWGSLDILITGNRFSSSGRIISMASGCASRVTISNNYLTSTQASATWEAIYLEKCPEASIVGNTIMMPFGRTGIALKGSNNSLVESNKIVSSSDGSAANSDNAGIFLYSIDASNLTSHCRVRGNTVRGFVKGIYDDNWTTPTASFNWIDSNIASVVATRTNSNSVFSNNRNENDLSAVNTTAY